MAAPEVRGYTVLATDVESFVSEARKKFEEIYKSYAKEIEEEARRVVSQRLSQIEPIKKEIVNSLRHI